MWYLVFSNLFDDTFIEANTRTKMGAPLLPASIHTSPPSLLIQIMKATLVHLHSYVHHNQYSQINE